MCELNLGRTGREAVLSWGEGGEEQPWADGGARATVDIF
jgi:hypothetical protein